MRSIIKTIPVHFQSIYRRVAGSLLRQFAVYGIMFIGSTISIRMLGPEGRGIYSWVMSFVMLGGTLAQFGMPQANRKIALTEPGQAATLFFLTLIICGIFSLVAMPVLYYIAATNEYLASAKSMFVTGMLCIPFIAVNVSLAEILSGLGQIHKSHILAITEKILNVAMLLLVISLGFITPEIVLILFLITQILRMLLTVILIYPYIRGKNLQSLSGQFVKHINFITASFVSTIFAQAFANAIPLFLGKSSNFRELGFFSSNRTLIDMVIMLPTLISYYSLPKILQEKSRRRGLEVQAGIIIVTIVVMALASLLLYLLAPFIIPLLFGKAFLEDIPIFRAMTLSLIFYGLYATIQAYIVAHSHKFTIALPPLIQAGFTVAMLFLFGDSLSPVRIAYIYDLSFAAALIPAIFITFRLYKKRNFS